jgi:hypothetical protein
MSSFGGETPVAFTTFSVSANGTAYTVPVGKYADIQLLVATVTGSGGGNISVTATVGGVAILDGAASSPGVVSVTNENGVTIRVGAGSVVSLSSSASSGATATGRTLTGVVTLYNIP